MSDFIVRPRLIRDVWIALFGEDPATKPTTGVDQHRVLCPYHMEREPSCDVAIAKNTFLCRSCGKAGGALDAVVAAGEASSRSAAIKWLQANGVTVC